MNDLQLEEHIKSYCLTKTLAPRTGLPVISEEEEKKLKEAYCRYQQFIGLTSGEFDESEIAEDRQKYSYLLLPNDSSGCITFGTEECIEYMSLVTGIPKDKCVVHEYEETVDLIGSDLIPGDSDENISDAYDLALQLIEKYSEPE